MLNKSRTGSSTEPDRETARDLAALVTSGLMLAVILNFLSMATGIAAAAASDSDAKCLACHSMKLEKLLENGERLSLQVPVADFTESVHSSFGCTSCHRDIDDRKHPNTKAVINNSRDYSVEQNQSCRNCHAAKFEQYEGSIHASLVADGNEASPWGIEWQRAHAGKARASIAST